MNPGVPVAYLQLKQHPRRLIIALAGLAISSLGILCQMGFEDSLFRSATRLFQELDADLVVISPQYQFMVLPAAFSERRLYQALSIPGVASFSSVRLGIAPFKNPVTRINRNVYVVGVGRVSVGRSGRVFANADWERKARALEVPDAVIFDRRSRREFGPIDELFRAGPVRTEINNHQIRIVNLFEMGASFSADGTAIVSEDGFSRLFPQRKPGLIDIGLIHLRRGASAERVLEQLRSALPNDVLVLTHEALNAREQNYWRGTTPAGFIFKTVLIISLIVGCVSAYQILYSDVAENLRQYATLKALGYPDSYFLRLTFEKAWLLSSMGYPLGFLLAEMVYVSATHLTLVPLVMTSARTIGVYAVMLAASSAAGLLAIHRLRRAQLSELF
jgi:putative ABC transport system permease protein